MFDWFIEMGQELGGIDSAAVKKERLERREQKKRNRFIFSGGVKWMVVVLGLLYIIMAGSMMIALKGVEEAALFIAKYAAMSVDAIVVIFALLSGKKKGEMIALAGIFIFVVGLYLSIVLV